jgi:hypothetical protein
MGVIDQLNMEEIIDLLNEKKPDQWIIVSPYGDLYKGTAAELTPIIGKEAFPIFEVTNELDMDWHPIKEEKK